MKVRASIAVHLAQSLASAGLLLAIALAPSHARADAGIALDWRAPAECPSADQVMAKVDRLLGNRTARPAAPIAVVASVARDGSSFRVRIEARRAETQVRELKGASCTAVANATALILAMMIDPSVASADADAGAAEKAPAAPADTHAPSAPKPPISTAAGEPAETAKPSAPGENAEDLPAPHSPNAPAGPAPPAPSGPPKPPAAPPRTETSEKPAAPAKTKAPPSDSGPAVSSGLMAWAGVDVGSLPGAAVGFGIAGLARYGATQFELGAGVFPDRSATLPERPSAGGDIGLVALSAGVCRALLEGLVELSPCASLELGLMHAAGFGVPSTERASVFWAGARGGGALTLRPVKPLGLHLRVEGLVPLTAPRFLLDGVGEVHQPSPGLRAALGVSLGL